MRGLGFAAMIVRLLLGLLLACLALPATAAMPCHDGGAAMAMPMPAASHHGDKAAAPHLCVGCVPPSSWRGAVVSAPLAPAALPPAHTLGRFTVGRSAPPATPPPRFEA
ncbi:hypothetical protein EAH79_13105 [Sphingomonas koreensis]|nr:hypothetical protein EAH79_13105 [Sphingomonas koreensis]